jgi:hypothetical protein
MALTTQELPRETWRPYFDDFSKGLGTVRATVEVDGRDIGAQIAAENVVLTGMTYDDKDDVLMVALDAPGGHKGEFEHLVDHPQKIFVATGDGADPVAMAIDIEDADEHQTIIRLELPAELPPA